MTASFPLGLGAPTTVYLALYLITWVLHFLLVSAVVGGAVIGAFAYWRGRSELANHLGGTLPLLLGLAITAGVAPLLFVQILYRDAFYTANLLLYVRFLAIVPALLVCFYLFYFVRTGRAKSLGTRWQGAILFVAAALAIFVGVSWAELHTLSIADGSWTEKFTNRSHTNVSPSTLVRALLFFSFAAPMTALVSTFVTSRQGLASFAKTLAPIASIGSIAALILTAIYARSLSGDAIDAVTTGVPLVHLVGFAGLGVILAALWAAAAVASERFSPLGWRLLMAASLAWLWCLAVVRETLRAVAVDFDSLGLVHARAWDTGGQLVFIVFGLVNVAAMAWCGSVVLRVWRNR